MSNANISFQEIPLEAKNAKKLFIDSIRSTGFAIITKVDLDFLLLQKLHNMWYDFFSNEIKYKYPFKEQTNEGYYPYAVKINGETKITGLVESFYYNICANLDIDKHLISVTNKLYDELLSITKKIFLWIAEYCEINMSEVFDLSKSCYRIMHYPPILGTSVDKEVEEYLLNESKEIYGFEGRNLRLPPHKDYSYITLLPRAEAIGGLEMLYKEKWLEIGEATSNSIVVNIGNMTQLVSNGFFRSTMHRVTLPHNKEDLTKSRISSAFFI